MRADCIMPGGFITDIAWHISVTLSLLSGISSVVKKRDCSPSTRILAYFVVGFRAYSGR